LSLVSFQWSPSARNLRVFAALQFVFFIVVTGAWRGGGALLGAPGWIVAGSAVVAVVGLIAPTLIRPLYLGWMLAVFPVGWALSYLILAAVFFLVITPIGMVMRWRGQDPLERKIDRGQVSYWKARPPSPSSERYFRQF
jgi:hypothetical protein